MENIGGCCILRCDDIGTFPYYQTTHKAEGERTCIELVKTIMKFAAIPASHPVFKPCLDTEWLGKSVNEHQIVDVSVHRLNTDLNWHKEMSMKYASTRPTARAGSSKQ